MCVCLIAVRKDEQCHKCTSNFTLPFDQCRKQKARPWQPRRSWKKNDTRPIHLITQELKSCLASSRTQGCASSLTEAHIGIVHPISINAMLWQWLQCRLTCLQWFLYLLTVTSSRVCTSSVPRPWTTPRCEQLMKFVVNAGKRED